MSTTIMYDTNTGQAGHLNHDQAWHHSWSTWALLQVQTCKNAPSWPCLISNLTIIELASLIESYLIMLDVNVVRGWCIMLDQGVDEPSWSIEVDTKHDRTWRLMISSLIKVDEIATIIKHEDTTLIKHDEIKIFMHHTPTWFMYHKCFIMMHQAWKRLTNL